MKKVIGIFLVLSLVVGLTMLYGCSGTEAEPNMPAKTVPNGAVEDGPVIQDGQAPSAAELSGDAEAEIDSIEAELDALESLEQELASSDLDSLDAELDFEI